MSAVLSVDALRAGYGNIDVLHGVTIELRQGELCAIVGANGAGKTTLLRAISGLIAKRGGTVRFGERDITHAPPHMIVRGGIAHVPEGRHMLPAMSVEENLLVAAAIAPRSVSVRTIPELYERFPILRERRALAAGSLSGGEAQMLAIARALVPAPRVLLLDEPSMGLAPKLVSEIFRIIADERVRGTSILLVEQNARRALALADQAYVLERGRILLHGTGAELLTDRDVTAAYLGDGVR